MDGFVLRALELLRRAGRSLPKPCVGPCVGSGLAATVKSVAPRTPRLVSGLALFLPEEHEEDDDEDVDEREGKLWLPEDTGLSVNSLVPSKAVATDSDVLFVVEATFPVSLDSSLFILLLFSVWLLAFAFSLSFIASVSFT